MKELSISYAKLVELVSGDKKLDLQYIESSDRYHLFAIESGVSWQTDILKNSSDGTDFETNHKASANSPGRSLVRLDAPHYGGRPSIRPESRPDKTVTYFTTRGDSATNLGDGTRWEWDFSNADNEISAPTGFKRKRIDVTFADDVWPKEGTIYFHNAPKGCYVDFDIVCPDQGFYLDRDGNVQQAQGAVIIDHFVNSHPLQGSVPMGDELNTESATIAAVPAGYIFRVDVTTPDTDTTSNGVVELEIFRQRTVLLPGESV